jgi:hypothetical protein
MRYALRVLLALSALTLTWEIWKPSYMAWHKQARAALFGSETWRKASLPKTLAKNPKKHPQVRPWNRPGRVLLPIVLVVSLVVSWPPLRLRRLLAVALAIALVHLYFLARLAVVHMIYQQEVYSLGSAEVVISHPPALWTGIAQLLWHSHVGTFCVPFLIAGAALYCTDLHARGVILSSRRSFTNQSKA